MLMKRQQRGELNSISTGKESIFKIVVHRRASICVEEGSAVVQAIWTMCLDEIVRYVNNEKRKVGMYEEVKSLFSMSLMYVSKILVDLLK